MFHAVFGKPLQNYVTNAPMETVTVDLIVWAQAKRKLGQLLDGALEHNSGNPQLRAAVDALRRKAPEPEAAVGAIALGELIEGADLDRCVYTAVLVYDLAAFKARVRDHVERASRRPDLARMSGQAAVQLRSAGYRPAIIRGAVAKSFDELVGEANDLRVFAVIAPAAARTTWPQQRSRYLAGLLGERFRKQDHGITRVLVLRDRLRESTAAVKDAWAQHGNSTTVPPVDAETPAGDALCGLCDGLASVVHRACLGQKPIPPAVRGKIVHIYDHVTKRNYRLADAFP